MKGVKFYKYAMLILLFISFMFLPNEMKANARLDQGIFDLSKEKITEDGPYNLDGNWAFYWMTFGTVDELIQVTPQYVHVPDDWSNYRKNSSMKYGYATYQMTIRMNESDIGEIVSLYMPSIATAYELRVNDELLAVNGEIGKTNEEMTPRNMPKIVTFKVDEQELDLNIQVSNFHQRKSGLWETIKFGTDEQILKIRERNLLFQMFVVGCIFIIGCYHLIMFIQRRKELSPIYFALTCFMIAIRTLLLKDTLFLKVFPSLNWELLVTIEYIAALMALLFFLLFIRQEHTEDTPHKLSNFYIFILVVYSIFVLVTEPVVFTNTFAFLQLLTISIISTIVTITIIGVFRKREGAILNVIAILVLTVAVLNDLLHYSNLIHTNELISVGLLFYLFIQSVHLARKFSRSFDKIERLSGELQELNYSLEKKVVHRTTALQMANEDLQKMEQSRKRLFASISHELNTPLTFIQGYIKAMMDGVVSKNDSSYLRMVYKDTQMMAHIINDLQELSKLESGKVKFSFKHIDISDFLKQLYQEQKFEAEGSKLNLIYKETNFPDDSKVICFIDPIRIKQVIVNLLVNAQKHTPEEGAITINVELLIERQQIKISVIDEGLGISGQDLPHIFDQFYKVESDGVKKGAGLGLAIVKEIVALHDGFVSVTSKENKGSSFSFTLPINIVQGGKLS